MDDTEALVLLGHLAELDRRKYDDVTARAWAWALIEVPLDDALEIALEAYDHGVRYIDVAVIREGWADRKARARNSYNGALLRGLIPPDWPKDRPLPREAQQRLEAARKAEYERTNDTTVQGALTGDGSAKAIDMGLRLKGTDA